MNHSPRELAAMFVAGVVFIAVAIAILGTQAGPDRSSALLHPVPGDTTGSDAMPRPETQRAITPIASGTPAPRTAIPRHCQPPGPDPRCTPGARNPAVTQATIHSTICVVGYSSSIRPSEAETEPLKYALMASYGYAGESPRGFELDHLIPLELGGAPLDTRNLWPEAHPGSFAKDGEENRLHAEVCAGSVGLRAAQHEMRTWGR